MQIPVVRNVLEANEKMAAHVRRQLSGRKILTLNLISSPGAGKTSLLERTLRDLAGEFRMAVIEGDLQTDNDARRVAATGAQAVQINTDGGCHLDSNMVLTALDSLELDGLDIHEHGLASAYAGFAINDATYAELDVNENTDLGEDDIVKASPEKVAAAVKVTQEAPLPAELDSGMHKVSIIVQLAKFESLKQALGSEVNVAYHDGKGKLTVHFYSDEQLKAFANLLGQYQVED